MPSNKKTRGHRVNCADGVNITFVLYLKLFLFLLELVFSGLYHHLLLERFSSEACLLSHILETEGIYEWTSLFYFFDASSLILL